MIKRYTFDEQFIIEEYMSGKSVMDLARYFGCSQTPIRKILFANNIPPHNVSNFQRRLSGHTLNDDIFDTLDEASLYWAGFIAADGNISKNNNNIKIKLAIKDIVHLEKLKTFVGGSQHIQVSKAENHKQCTYTFASAKIKNILFNLGIKPVKSKTIVVSDTLSNSRHFWRGVVDGDGYIGIGVKPSGKKFIRFSLVSASLDFIKQFIAFVYKELGIMLSLKSQNFSKYNTQSGVLYNVSATYAKAVSILRLLYSDSSVHLDRKILIIENYLIAQPI